MSYNKKKKGVSLVSKNKSNVVFHMSKEEATLIKMPKFNGYAGGYGAHGDKKYNRNKEKRSWRKEIGATSPDFFYVYINKKRALFYRVPLLFFKPYLNKHRI